jgi:hypothetical protein
VILAYILFGNSFGMEGSDVFFEIPQADLEPKGYRRWLDHIIYGWVYDKEGNKFSNFDRWGWNEEGGLSGNFGGRFIEHVKFYRTDGTRSGHSFYHCDQQGVIIRDHDYLTGVIEKVQCVANSLEAYLRELGVEFTRFNH